MIIAIATLLVALLPADVKLQNAKLERTHTSDDSTSRWFVRPYVPVYRDGKLMQVKQRIYLGQVSLVPEREAQRARRVVLDKINRRQIEPQARQLFGDFLDSYIEGHVSKLAVSTHRKYACHINKHIRPAFGAMRMCDINTQLLDRWLAGKERDGLSWRTRLDLRNIVSGAFTCAERWGYSETRNPAKWAKVGRRRVLREQRKMSIEETRLLLSALPDDVREICMMALSCTLRISEILGLQWRHIDFERGVVCVRQRYYRGDLDVAKTERASRDVPLGTLTDELRKRYPSGPGHENDFVFNVKTKHGFTRDDGSIRSTFLRPAAKAVGVYWKGFGFHAFRREAVTSIAANADALQAMRAAGHSRMDVTLGYGLNDLSRQDEAIRRLQRAIKTGEAKIQ